MISRGAALRGRVVMVAGSVLALSVATQLPAGAAGASVTPPGAQAYTIYTPPAGTPGQHTADEPSIGVDWKTNATMYQADVTTLKVVFDDKTTPATATWTDVSAPLTNHASLDPILFTDSSTGRTIVSQLVVACSLSELTDDDGATWIPNQGCGLNGVEDHQTVGGGPFHAPAPTPPAPAYPHAVYYCNQDIANSTVAYCALSADGGLTYGPGIPTYNLTQCGGLHGHIRVAPDGTTILPNQNCAPTANPSAGGPFPNQAAVVTINNGATWSVNVIPDSLETLRSDPSVAADAGGRWYFGYEQGVKNTAGTQVAGRAMISMSADDGTTWSPSVDVGAPLGIQNVTFPEVIAGDAGRAAYAFLGSTSAGNPEDTSFQGYWYLYIASTTDGGSTWSVSNLTPGDPVERGCIFLAGNGSCPSAKRNLLDFMDIASDNQGRVEVGYADGCTGTCVTDQAQPCSDAICSTGPTASTDKLVSIARESCGVPLVAKNDAALACGQQAVVPEVPWAPLLPPLGALGASIAWQVARRRGARAGATG